MDDSKPTNAGDENVSRDIDKQESTGRASQSKEVPSNEVLNGGSDVELGGEVILDEEVTEKKAPIEIDKSRSESGSVKESRNTSSNDSDSFVQAKEDGREHEEEFDPHPTFKTMNFKDEFYHTDKRIKWIQELLFSQFQHKDFEMSQVISTMLDSPLNSGCEPPIMTNPQSELYRKRTGKETNCEVLTQFLNDDSLQETCVFFYCKDVIPRDAEGMYINFFKLIYSFN